MKKPESSLSSTCVRERERERERERDRERETEREREREGREREREPVHGKFQVPPLSAMKVID